MKQNDLNHVVKLRLFNSSIFYVKIKTVLCLKLIVLF